MNMMRERAKGSYDNYTQLFLNKTFDIHFNKLKAFFDNIEKLLASGLTADMIKFQTNCGKNLLQKLLKEYRLKYVKKSVARMQESIMKLFSSSDSAVEVVISGKAVDVLTSNFNTYTRIIEECYPKDKSLKFDFTVDDLKEYWNEIYSAAK